MQYLRGKMMAVTSAARRDMEGRQSMAGMQQQQPSSESVIKPDYVDSDAQKRKVFETEEKSEVKRVKINQSESGLRMENIVNEEWKRISLGIEKQARAIHLQVPEATDTKAGEFGSELKRTIINKPLSESKQTGSGTVSSSRIGMEHQPKHIVLSDSASRTKQDQESVKSREKRHRWDDPKESGKGRKYEDDKRSHQKHSPSYKSRRTPPKSYQNQPVTSRYGARHVWSLHGDKHEKDSTASKGTVGRLSASLQSKDVIIIDDQKSKQIMAAAKAAEKSPVSKASSSSQPASSSSTATTAASSMASFKFGWKSKVVKPTLPKPGVQSIPLPGYKAPDKGGSPTIYVYYCKHLVCGHSNHFSIKNSTDSSKKCVTSYHTSIK